MRWISQSELCVIPFDSSNVPGCTSRKHPEVQGRIYAEARASLKSYAAAAPFLACMKVSREIQSGDSVLVVIGAIGGAVSEGLSSERVTRVWFREKAGVDSMWLAAATSGDVIASSMAPILAPTNCK